MPNAQKLLLVSNAACWKRHNTIHGVWPGHANTRSITQVHKMNRLHLALTIVFTSLASAVFAGTGNFDLQPAPSPAQDENKNSTEIFEYETTYTGTSDFQKYNGKFGDGDSLYNDFSYAHRFLITGNWYLRL